MAVYLRTADDKRVLLDTAKAKLNYEGVEYDLTGAALEFFEATWVVVNATLGSAATPARGFAVSDTFTGLRVEVAFPQEVADRVALAFADDPERPKRLRRVRRALGI